ncbi:MAG: nucleotidyltransferase domain-containing protein [Bdellovibrionales bacterium]|nr:nucleotidyltransferase domain-containing protein [Bdellovibrionales bacterium]
MSGYSSAFQELPNSVKELVRQAVSELRPQEIILFGSRARDKHRENSDFDLCLKGASPDATARARFRLRLDEEAITLHRIDLVFHEELNEDYVRNIGTEGKLLYAR